MSVVDKSSVGLGERQFHIGVAPGEVSTVALMAGIRAALLRRFASQA